MDAGIYLLNSLDSIMPENILNEIHS